MIGTIKYQSDKWIIYRTNGQVYPLHPHDIPRGKVTDIYKQGINVHFVIKSDRYGCILYGYDMMVLKMLM